MLILLKLSYLGRHFKKFLFIVNLIIKLFNIQNQKVFVYNKRQISFTQLIFKISIKFNKIIAKLPCLSLFLIKCIHFLFHVFKCFIDAFLACFYQEQSNCQGVCFSYVEPWYYGGKTGGKKEKPWPEPPIPHNLTRSRWWETIEKTHEKVISCTGLEKVWSPLIIRECIPKEVDFSPVLPSPQPNMRTYSRDDLKGKALFAFTVLVILFTVVRSFYSHWRPISTLLLIVLENILGLWEVTCPGLQNLEGFESRSSWLWGQLCSWHYTTS